MYILVHSRITKVWLHSDIIFELLGKGRIQRRCRAEINEFMASVSTVYHSSKNVRIELMFKLETETITSCWWKGMWE